MAAAPLRPASAYVEHPPPERPSGCNRGGPVPELRRMLNNAEPFARALEAPEQVSSAEEGELLDDRVPAQALEGHLAVISELLGLSAWPHTTHMHTHNNDHSHTQLIVRTRSAAK